MVTLNIYPSYQSIHKGPRHSSKYFRIFSSFLRLNHSCYNYSLEEVSLWHATSQGARSTTTFSSKRGKKEVYNGSNEFIKQTLKISVFWTIGVSRMITANTERGKTRPAILDAH